MIRYLLSTILVIIALGFNHEASSQIIKKGFYFPDAGAYQVLKCDFHTHTVFSDGDMWPSRRLYEAAGEDIDAISITDHIEYTPNQDEFKEKNHNRSYELAQKHEKNANVILIRGTEITRSMPPGHFNAIYIKDANIFESFVNKEDSRDGSNIEETIAEARKQGAFVFWNHPSFPGPSDVAILYPIHETLIAKKLIDGIEVVNGPKYEPEAFEWCLDNNLAILGTSDVHRIMSQDMIERAMLHRSMTLVLATNRSAESIREAIDNRRTVAILNHTMYGKTENVKEIFQSAVKVEAIGDISEGVFEFSNLSGFPFQFDIVDLEPARKPRTIVLDGHSNALVILKGKDDVSLFEKDKTLNVKVLNIFTRPDQNLSYKFKF
jgi:3',5'-nucleoside bisphosphate phosphatase